MASNFPRSEGDKSAPEAAGEVAVHPETWLDVDVGAGEVATHPDTWPDFTAYGGFNDSADAPVLKQTVKVPASGVVVSLAREFITMNRKTGLNFPLDDDEDDDFNLSDAQQEHVLAVQELVPRLDILRTLLCPDHKSESLFWKSYFVHIYPKLEKEDALLLSTPQLVKAWAKAMSMEGDNSARNAIGVTDRVVSFAKQMARYPEVLLDYLLLDGDVDPDFKMSEAHQKHALAINHLVPSLAALRLELCSCRMSESCFWKIYFVYIHPILEEDAKQLSTSQILKVWANLSTELQELRKRIISMDEERPSPDRYPWVLMKRIISRIINEEDDDVQTFYIMGTEQEYITKHYNISGIHASERGFGGLKVCASCRGWIILVSQFSGSCFLLDVLSMEKVRLPKIPSLDMVPDTYSRKNYFVMTAAATDRDCLVGLFSTTKRSFLIWRPGRRKWSVCTIDMLKTKPELVPLSRVFPRTTVQSPLFVKLDPKRAKRLGKVDFTRIGGKFWTGVGVNRDVVSFARDLAMDPKNWIDFSLRDDEDGIIKDFELSDAQQEHVLAMEHLVPTLDALKMTLCPSCMREGRFWMIYFAHLHPILEDEDAALLSTWQIVKPPSRGRSQQRDKRPSRRY